MIKVKYILAHIILILFLSCNGSGGCNNLNPNNKQTIPENKDKYIESASKEDSTELEVLSGQNQIEPINTKPDVINTPIDVKKISKNIPQKPIPKATYVPFTNAPETIKPISPEYPLDELNKSIEGIVYIQFRIDTSGNVAESYIAKSSGNNNLDQAALNAIVASKWQPAKNQGKTVSVWQTLPFEFKLSN